MTQRRSRIPRDNRPERKLFAAIRSGDLDGVNDMLDELGSRMVLSMEMPGQTVMQTAVEFGQEDILQLLLKEGADANEKLWNGDTLLHIAVKKQMTSIVRLLLEYGADPATSNLHNERVIHIAMTENLPDMARVLLAHGNDPVRTTERATHWIGKAREWGLVEMVTALQDLTESFHQHDPEFKLYAAIMTKNHRRVVDLIDQHVNPFDVKLGEIKMSPLHAAARQSDVRLLAMLLSRLDKIKRVNAEDGEGQTPLHYAAAKNNEENVDWLVFSGADPDIEDMRRKKAEDLATEIAVKWILKRTINWISVPDAIIVMRGEWRVSLLRTDCTLSHSQVPSHDLDLPSDDDLPPVLMFRRTTRDAEDGEREKFEQSSFSVKDICCELYEYRSSEPSCICFTIDWNERNFDPDTQKLILKHKFAGSDCMPTEQELTVHSDRQSAECDVSLSGRGQLALVCRVEHTVAIVHAGPEGADFRPEELPGFELEIPPDTFHERQDILIKAEPPPPIDSGHGDGDADIFPIKNISFFYNIINTEGERPHKSMQMSIPLQADSDNVMSFLLKRAPRDGDHYQSTGPAVGLEILRDIEELGEIEPHLPEPAQQHPDDDDASSDDSDVYSDDFEDDEESIDVTDQPTWTLLPDVTVVGEEDVIRMNIQDMGVVVAAEVCPGVRSEDVIRAIQDMYSRQQKKEILIFSVAKPAPNERVEVMLCCVSGETYDAVLARLVGQGYRLLQEPIVAYALNRETFLLTLRGNLTDIYADDDQPVLEYQVGGRLNYTAFVLEAAKKNEPASGVIKIYRTTSENSQHASVGRLHLDLTHFFSSAMSTQREAKSEGQLSDIDKLLMKLAEKMNTDYTRVYCYALGLTKRDLEKVATKLYLSPTEKVFRMLSLTKSIYRSEAAFFNHLLDVLQKHKEKKLVGLLQNSLQQMNLE